ncbi:hypothetical protein F5X98DRAFT_264547 [Xylaria grammica]|nr:hypothetical protein F5X98DRAFT_264547 [Xylaria grammica]
MGHQPSAGRATHTSFSPISHLSKSDTHNVSKGKKHDPDLAPDEAQRKCKPKLKKPLSKKARRIITKNTTKLIKRRNTLDRKVLDAVKKTTPNTSDWLRRDRLLRSRERLERREKNHLRKRTKKLAELERLYRWDPSPARASGHDLVRSLLWRFKRNLGPLLDEYTNQLSKGNDDNDETNSNSSGSGSELDLGGTSDGDEEFPQEVITAKSSPNSRQETAKGPDLHSQNTAVTENFIKEAPIRIQVSGGKRKHRKALSEGTPPKQVRFALDENIDKPKYGQENSKMERERKKNKKEKQAPVQEAQINDK